MEEEEEIEIAIVELRVKRRGFVLFCYVMLSSLFFWFWNE